jgi:hypothetical protein
MRIPSTTTKMNPVIARTRIDNLRTDSAGGETGSKIDRFWHETSAPASSTEITAITPFSCRLTVALKNPDLGEISQVLTSFLL